MNRSSAASVRPVDDAVRRQLVSLADRYETADFIHGDPSWFMHQVTGERNREAMAFVASALSYGSRTQFMPRVATLLDHSGGDIDAWIRSGAFADILPPDDHTCFYRLYTRGQMHRFLSRYRALLADHGTLGHYVRRHAATGIDAIDTICRYFDGATSGGIVPRDTQSACKRVAMFMRWMVRSHSPVDLGLWADIIDRRTLVMPLDTHVLQEARRLGLLDTSCATMTVARRLTATMASIFPDDPLRGDFALFGYGVDSNKMS